VYPRLGAPQTNDPSTRTTIPNAFGPLRPGATTPYQRVDVAIKEAAIFIITDQNPLPNKQPETGSMFFLSRQTCLDSAPILSSGKYTYVLSLGKDKELVTEVIKDR